MAFVSMCRLLGRRANLSRLAMLGFVASWSLFVYQDPELTLDHPRPGGLNLFVLATSALAGHFFAGLGVVELQHASFSWTLPNLRRRLLASVLLLGVVTAFLLVGVYVRLGGPAPWLPVFTSGLLWYSVGIVIAAGDVRGGSDRPWRPYLAATLAIAALFAAGVFINRIAELYGVQPFLFAALTLAGASLCLFLVFNVGAARQKSLVPTPLGGLGDPGSLERAAAAHRRTPKRTWRLKGPVKGLFDWVRAGEYENFASVRGGWAAGAVRFSAVAALIVIALPYVTEAPGLSYLKGLMSIAPCVPAFLAMGYCANNSFFLQKGWLYPLSRAQLARLAYWSSLSYNAAICGIMLLTFALLASASAIEERVDFIRPLVLIFVFNPFFQWLRLRHGPLFFQVPIAGLLYFAGGVGCVGLFRLAENTGMPLPYEAAAAAGLALLSQGLFRYKIEACFRTRDLV